jgi:hypothetical protein
VHCTDKTTFCTMPKPACCKSVHGLRASGKNLHETKRQKAGNYLQRTEWMSLESGRSNAISTAAPFDARHRASTAEDDNGGHAWAQLERCGRSD